MPHRSKPFVIFGLLCVSFVAASVRAEDKPSVIRVATPGVGNGNRPFVGGSAWSIVHLRGMFEEEFKPDGIRVEWSFLRGAGPAVNELFVNGLADISAYGDLPSTVGRAGGLKTRVLAGSTGFNFYIAVPSDSSIQSIKDLRGKRVAVFKGTANQLGANRILARYGLSEQDLRTINMDNATARAALVTKDVDAVLGGSDLLQLRDQGVARILFTTKSDPSLAGNGALVVTDNFARKYPGVVKRIVKVYVLAAKWLAEANPSDAYRLWSKSGFPFSNFKEDFVGDDLRQRSSPLLDATFAAAFRSAIADEKRFGLLKETFPIEGWFDPSFLQQVLKEERLEQFWKPQSASAAAQTGPLTLRAEPQH